MSDSAAFVPMFGPDGLVHQVPQERYQDLLGNGGKVAVRMVDPGGVKRYIPHDRVVAMQQQGLKVAPDEPLQAHPQANEPGFWASVANVFGIPTTQEGIQQFPKQFAQTAATRLTSGMQPGNPASLLFPTPQEAVQSVKAVAPKVAQEAKATVAAAKRGQAGPALAHAGGTVGYGAATLTAPVGGTQMATAGEQLGERNIRGGLGTTTALVAPFAVGAAMSGKVPKIAPEASHVEALTGLIDDRAGAVNPHETATTALPEARAQAVKMGVTPDRFEGRAGGELVTGKDGILNRAIQEHRAQYAEIKRPFAGEQMDATPIAKAYLDRITPEMLKNAPEEAAALHREAEKFVTFGKDGQITGTKPLTLDEMDAFRERINKKVNAYEQKGVGQQIMSSDVLVKADAAAADAARDQLYPALGRLSGKGEAFIRNLKAREGALAETRNSLTKEFNRASGAQGEAVSRTLREKVAGTYPSPRGVGHKAIKEVLGPKPLAVFNNRLKAMFGDLPERGQLSPPTGEPAPAAAPAPTGPQLGPGAEGLKGTTRSINLGGQRIGRIEYSVNGDTLTIDQFTTNAGVKAAADKALGQPVTTAAQLSDADLSSIAKQLKAEHPDVKFIQATRVGGARGSEGRAVRIPIDRFLRESGPKAPATTQPSPTMPSAALQAPQGVSRASQATLIMLAAKEGSITQQEANRRIQKLVGNGGTRTLRRPAD